MDEKTLMILADISKSMRTIALAEKVTAECNLALLHSTDKDEERRIREKFFLSRFGGFVGDDKERRK